METNAKKMKKEIVNQIHTSLLIVKEAIEGIDQTEDIDKLINTLEEVSKQTLNSFHRLRKLLFAIKAGEWLNKNVKPEWKVSWEYFHHQLKDSNTPDIKGVSGRKTVASAFVSISEKPVGVVDKRIASNLWKLSQMKGELYYFVRSDQMKKRAESKIKKSKYQIKVVVLK